MVPDFSTSLLRAAAQGRPVPAWAGLALQLVVAGVAFVPFISAVGMIGIWAERKISARIQSRVGPNRVGPFGLWQSIADGAKLLMKEDLVPAGADAWLFRLAPYLAFVPVFAAFAAVPFGPELTFEPHLSAGVFWLLAILSVEVIGVILAGWASNNKWSVYGGIREACQMVCYEVPLGLSIIIGVMTAGTLSLVRLGEIQGGGLQTWLAFRNPFTLGAFVVYFVASLAANKRAPFDLPEGESELVAGYHTEYSGLRFSLFFFAEYAGMFVVAAIQTTLYLGGWNDPFGLIGYWHQRIAGGPVGPLLVLNLVAAAVFVAKCSLLVLVQMWVRWTFPRPRIDQVLYACVKVLLPMACALLLGAAVWQLFLPERAGVPWVDYQPWAVGDWVRNDAGPAWFVQVVLAGGGVVFAAAVAGFVGHAFVTGRTDRRRLFEAELIPG
jgi:NADH-quinone oxidoreductase subunit H